MALTKLQERALEMFANEDQFLTQSFRLTSEGRIEYEIKGTQVFGTNELDMIVRMMRDAERVLTDAEKMDAAEASVRRQADELYDDTLGSCTTAGGYYAKAAAGEKSKLLAKFNLT